MPAQVRLVEPSNENRSVPVRPPNAALRTREYLTPAEIEKLIRAAKNGRWGHRDATLILIAFRHGLRASEICDLEWSQVEFGRSPSLHVRRAKNGKPSVHPVRGNELRALRKLHAETQGNFVFETERGGPFTPDAVNRQLKRIGERAGFDFPLHAHMLRHGCGYALANAGARHQGHSRLAWASLNPAYRTLYRTGTDAVQGLLEIVLAGLKVLKGAGVELVATQVRRRLSDDLHLNHAMRERTSA
jgi:integrase